MFCSRKKRLSPLLSVRPPSTANWPQNVSSSSRVVNSLISCCLATKSIGLPDMVKRTKAALMPIQLSPYLNSGDNCSCFALHVKTQQMAKTGFVWSFSSWALCWMRTTTSISSTANSESLKASDPVGKKSGGLKLTVCPQFCLSSSCAEVTLQITAKASVYFVPPFYCVPFPWGNKPSFNTDERLPGWNHSWGPVLLCYFWCFQSHIINTRLSVSAQEEQGSTVFTFRRFSPLLRWEVTSPSAES